MKRLFTACWAQVDWFLRCLATRRLGWGRRYRWCSLRPPQLEALSERILLTATVTVSAPDPDASEQGPDTGTITITRTGDVQDNLTVSFVVFGSATPDLDYTYPEGPGTFHMVTFAPGQTQMSFLFTPEEDGDSEGDETILVDLNTGMPGDYDIGSPSYATITIHEGGAGQSLPVVSIVASDAYASEVGPDSGTFTLTRTQDTSQALTVSYTVSGTGTAGTDYSTLTGQVVFGVGETTATIDIVPMQDYPLIEGSESVVLTISANPSLYQVGSPASATVDIADAPVLQWHGPTFTWTQTFTPPPLLTDPGEQSNAEGDAISLLIQASDPNDYPLTFAAVNLPIGLNIDPDTGVISGTIDYKAGDLFLGSYTSTVIVANDRGGSTSIDVDWSVGNTDRAPTLANPGNQSSMRGDKVSHTLSGSDPDQTDLFYDAGNLPPGLSIDVLSGVISGTIELDASPGTYDVTVSVTDGPNTTSQSFTWTVGVTNDAPLLSAIDDQFSAAGDAVYLAVPSSDDDGDERTHTATGLPTGLSIDAISGQISGTVADSAVSATPYQVTVFVFDGKSSASQSFSWSISALGLVQPADQTSLAGESVELAVIGHSALGEVSFSATGLPTGTSIDSATGVISGTIPAGSASAEPYAVTVSASDGVDTISRSFEWKVKRLLVVGMGDRSDREGNSVSVQVEVAGADLTPSFSATGLPSGLSIDAETGEITGTLAADAHEASPCVVRVTATQDDFEASAEFVWSVTPRVALVYPGRQANATGDSVQLQLVATALAGGPLTFDATGLPAGLVVDPATGLITGTIDGGASGLHIVTLSASDGTSSSQFTLAWDINPVYLPTVPEQESIAGEAVTLSLAAHYHGQGTLAYGATGLPTGLTIDSETGEISGTPAANAYANSPYHVTVSVDDGTDTATRAFDWTVTPRVTLVALDEQQNAVGDEVSLQPSAVAATAATLSYSATGLPDGLSIDAETGEISGTIAVGADAMGPYEVTVTASDNIGSASQAFLWRLEHLALTNPGTQMSAEGGVVSLFIQGHDGDGSPVSFSAVGLPTGLSIDFASGEISGTVATGAAASGPYWTTVTISDGSHLRSASFQWSVVLLLVTNPGEQASQEGESVSLSLTAIGNGTVTWSATGLPEGLSIDSETGVVTGTVAAFAADYGPYQVTVVATTGTTSASRQFNWAIAPRVEVQAIENQSSVDGAVVSVQVQASAQGAMLTFAAEGLPEGLNIDSETGEISGTIANDASNEEPYQVAVTASDGTYSATTVFDWVVRHASNQAPVLSNPGMQSNAVGDRVVLALGASDADEDTPSYSVTGLPSGLRLDARTGVISGTLGKVAPGTRTVTVSADDGNGGTSSQTFSWVVAPSPLKVMVNDVELTQGSDTKGVVLANLTILDRERMANGLQARIDWGDGQKSSATVQGGSGAFTITGRHVYTLVGTFPLTVSITDEAGQVVVQTGTATVTAAQLLVSDGYRQGAIRGQIGSFVLGTVRSSNPRATVEDFTVEVLAGDGGTIEGELTALGNGAFVVSVTHAYQQTGLYTADFTVSASGGSEGTGTSSIVVGHVYAGPVSNLDVATFTDSMPGAQATDYTATITWGDGSTGTGSVVAAGGAFVVQGNHVYAVDSIDEPNLAYVVSVSVQSADGRQLTASSDVIVVRPPAKMYMANAIGDEEGTVGDAVLAVFTEPNYLDPTSEFTAAIDWGDGSTSSGTIEGGSGLFTVRGGHAFANLTSGQFTVRLSQGWSAFLPFAVAGKMYLSRNGFPAYVSQLVFEKGYQVKRDSDGFTGMQWGFDGGTGAFESLPFAYIRGSTLEVKAVLQPRPGIASTPPLHVKGFVVGRNFLTTMQSQQAIEFGDDGYVFQGKGTLAFPGSVNSFEPLTIYWFVSRTGGVEWYPVGVTWTRTYLLYAKPADVAFLYETPVVYGSRGAAGKTKPTEILAGIWKNFASLKAKRADGAPLTYYKEWIKAGPGGTPVVASALNMSDLLAAKDGQCLAFVELFYNAIAAQGLPTNAMAGGIGEYKAVQIVSKTEGEGFLIQPWLFGAKNTTAADYPWKNTLAKVLKFGTDDYPPIMGTEYQFMSGMKDGKPRSSVRYLGKLNPKIVAQNNTNPVATFYNHYLVKIGDKYYDPSYGNMYSSLLDVQNGLSGFFKIDAKAAPDGTYTMHIRKSKLGVLQLEEKPA